MAKELLTSECEYCGFADENGRCSGDYEKCETFQKESEN